MVIFAGDRELPRQLGAEADRPLADFLDQLGDLGLQFVGRVGTGFTDKALAELKRTLKPLETDESPFNERLPRPDAKGVTFVRPELVGEVRYSERTSDNRLRQPSWRGLRPDKTPADVNTLEDVRRMYEQYRSVYEAPAT